METHKIFSALPILFLIQCAALQHIENKVEMEQFLPIEYFKYVGKHFKRDNIISEV